MPGEDDRIPYAVVCRHSPLRAAEDLELHGNEPDMPVEIEAPLSEDRGFTLTIRQLFQGAKPPERHRPYKVCAADLLIRWSAPKGHRTPETIHAELDKRAKKEALSLFSR